MTALKHFNQFCRWDAALLLIVLSSVQCLPLTDGARSMMIS